MTSLQQGSGSQSPCLRQPLTTAGHGRSRGETKAGEHSKGETVLSLQGSSTKSWHCSLFWQAFKGAEPLGPALALEGNFIPGKYYVHFLHTVRRTRTAGAMRCARRSDACSKLLAREPAPRVMWATVSRGGKAGAGSPAIPKRGGRWNRRARRCIP